MRLFTNFQEYYAKSYEKHWPELVSNSSVLTELIAENFGQTVVDSLELDRNTHTTIGLIWGFVGGVLLTLLLVAVL